MKIDLKVIIFLALALIVFFEDVESQRNPNRRLRKNRKQQRNRGSRRPRRPRPDPSVHPGRPFPRPPPPPPPPFGDDCGPIPHLVNGFAIQSTENVQYACQPGFRLEGTNVITCLNGRWTVAPRCVRQICPVPHNPPFATKVGESTHGGAPYVEYKCFPNYYMTGTNGLTTRRVFCNVATRQWGEFPVCTPVTGSSCLSVPNVAGGIFEISLSGIKATLKCHQGYTLDATKPSQLFCVNNQWDTSNGMPACVHGGSGQIRCTFPPRCGGMTQTRPPVSGAQPIGTEVQYTCKAGFRVIGSSNSVMTTKSKCLSTGVWSEVKECEPKVCPPPQFSENVREIPPSSSIFMAEYTYQCKLGYETVDPTTTFCNSEGKWNHPSPNCIAKKCDTSAPVFENVQDITQPDFVAVDTTITFHCRQGYRAAPSNPNNPEMFITITCLSTGTFTSTDKKCVPHMPKSCKDYFERDNLFNAAANGVDMAVTLKIDASMTIGVVCRKEGDKVLTIVKSNDGTELSNSNPCTSTDFGIAAPSIVVQAPVLGCGVLPITYDNSEERMMKLISVTNNCKQQVMIECDGSAQGMFTVVKRQGMPALSYSSEGAEVVQSDFTSTERLFSGVCDCHGDSDTHCEQYGCKCTVPDGTTLSSSTDSITFQVDSDNGWVTATARGRRFDDISVNIGSGVYEVEVGDIQCDEIF